MANDIENLRKKLLYQSWYRGTKETDLMLGPFARAEVPNMGMEVLKSYEQFLNESDIDIYNWVTGQKPAPDFVDQSILGQIQAFWNQEQEAC